MRPYFRLVLIGTWLLTPGIGTAQPPGNEKAIADFYWRTGQYQSALFYTQLQEKRAQVQQPKELPKPPSPPKETAKPPSLEQLIAEALKNNPDIRVAESKMREADAELSRTRMKVVSDVTFLQAEIQAAKAIVDYVQKQHLRALELEKSHAIDGRSVTEAALALEKAKADLAVKQAKLPYLLGKQTGTSAAWIDASILKLYHDPKTTDQEFLRRATLDLWGRVPTPEEMNEFLKVPEKDRRQKWIDHLLKRGTGVQGFPYPLIDVVDSKVVMNERNFSLQAIPSTTLTKKLRKALDATGTLKDEADPDVVLGYVRENMLPGINLQVRAKLPGNPISPRLTEPVPVGAVLQFLEEELKVIFVLRDYGIVVVTADEHLPPGAIRVVDFWKNGKAEAPTPEPKQGK